MASRLAVDIAIESLLENEVEEISRDGQEKYVPWVFFAKMTKIMGAVPSWYFMIGPACLHSYPSVNRIIMSLKVLEPAKLTV